MGCIYFETPYIKDDGNIQKTSSFVMNIQLTDENSEILNDFIKNFFAYFFHSQTCIAMNFLILIFCISFNIIIYSNTMNFFKFLIHYQFKHQGIFSWFFQCHCLFKYNKQQGVFFQHSKEQLSWKENIYQMVECFNKLEFI